MYGDRHDAVNIHDLDFHIAETHLMTCTSVIDAIYYQYQMGFFKLCFGSRFGG